jgi:hypothetical protein
MKIQLLLIIMDIVILLAYPIVFIVYQIRKALEVK